MSRRVNMDVEFCDCRIHVGRVRDPFVMERAANILSYVSEAVEDIHISRASRSFYNDRFHD